VHGLWTDDHHQQYTQPFPSREGVTVISGNQKAPSPPVFLRAGALGRLPRAAVLSRGHSRNWIIVAGGGIVTALEQDLSEGTPDFSAPPF